MATTFIARLPVGHPLRKATVSTTTDLLGKDERVKGVVPGSVADKREWCAALLYLADNAPFTDAALGRISAAEKSVLFAMLNVGQDGGTAAASARLFAAANNTSVIVTFVSLLPATDLETASLTKAQATQILRQLPFKIPTSPSAEQLRELCAARVWCESVLQTPGDIQALPDNLRGVLETWFEIPNLSNAARATSAVALWTAVHPQPAVAPPQPGPPEPPVQTGVQQPQINYGQQGFGIQQCQQQPAPPPQQAQQGSAQPPPPWLPWAGSGPAGLGCLGAVGGNGAAGVHQQQYTPTVWGQIASPHRIIFSNAQQLAAAAAGYSGFPGINPANPWAAGGAALLQTGAMFASSLQQQEMIRARAALNSLAIDVSKIMTPDENKALLNQQKVLSSEGGVKTPIQIPYANIPWQQALLLPTNGELDPAVVARQLSIALTCDSQEYTADIDVMMRKMREDAVQKIHTEFDTAFNDGDLAGIQLAAERMRLHCTTEMEGILARAREQASRFASAPEFQEVMVSRQVQAAQLPVFLATIASKIVGKGGADQATRIAGAWKLFMDNWGAKGISTTTLARIQQAGQTFKPKIPGQREASEESEHRHMDRKPTGKGTPEAGKGQPAANKDSGKKMSAQIKVTIPCSPGVVGTYLGARPPATACHNCERSGHWKADCPKAWGEAGCALPGFSARGNRLLARWEGDNPTKETFKEWVKFIEDSENFPKGARQAPLDNSPDLQRFKTAARRGVPP